MYRFTFAEKEELKKYLYYKCSVHDAVIRKVQYDHYQDKLMLSIFNPIDKTRYEMTFAGIAILLSINGYKWGKYDGSISSLTIEDDYAPIEALREPGMKPNNEYLYLVFQMFTGNELHMLLNEVLIEESEAEK